MISVSSGRVTNKAAVCSETISASTLTLSIYRTASTVNDSIPFGATVNPGTSTLNSVISSELFSVSDQTDGHAYRISSIQSETYMSTRKYPSNGEQILMYILVSIVESGALYCGGITLTQIATSITTAMNSQTSL